MKKILLTISLVMTIIMSCSLCACNKDSSESFFSKSVLEDNLVPDLPKIACEKAEKEYSKVYWFKTTEENFNEYVSSVYEYLCSLNFKYLGYRGEQISSFFGAAPTYEFFIGTELADFKYTEDRSGHKLENCYVFVWANDIYTDTNDLKSMHYLYLSYVSDRELEVYMELSFTLESYRLIEL